MIPLKLMFVRHAQSVGNVEKRMQGGANFPLTELGRTQAAKLAHRLVAESWHPTHLYSSPIRRAVQTAEIVLANLISERLPASVADETGLTEWNLTTEAEAVRSPGSEGDRPTLPITYADDLVEHKNGIFEGLTWAEAQQQHPQLCADLEASLDWIQVPGSETLTDARTRSQRFIQRLLETHQNGDHVLIISHSWILQHLLSVMLGCDRVWRIPSTNTGLFEFWVERSRWEKSDDATRFNTDLWQLRRFNDCQHLQS